MIGLLCCADGLYWLLLFMSSGLLLCLPSWFSFVLLFASLYVMFPVLLQTLHLPHGRSVLYVLFSGIFVFFIPSRFFFTRTSKLFCTVLFLCPFFLLKDG